MNLFIKIKTLLHDMIPEIKINFFKKKDFKCLFLTTQFL